MEWLVDLIEDNKIPIGVWAKQFSEWAKVAFKDFFDVVTVVLKVPMDGTSDLLLAVPPLVLILIFAGIAYLLQRNWRIVALVVLGLSTSKRGAYARPLEKPYHGALQSFAPQAIATA